MFETVEILKVTKRILEEDNAGCGHAVDYIIVPKELLIQFIRSDLYIAALQILKPNGKILVD